MFSKLGSKFGAAIGTRRSPGVRSGAQVNSRLRRALRVWGVLLVLASLALEVVGCNGWLRPVDWSEMGPASNSQPKSPFKVIPRDGRNRANLKSDDIVRVMQRIGFADEQVLELGTALHDALAVSGAAEVTYRKEKLVIFMVDGDYVRIRSRSSAFDYQLSTGQFASPSPEGQ